MKSSELSHGFRPFENLQSMLDSRLSKKAAHKTKSKPHRKQKLSAAFPSTARQIASTPKQESELFLEAMHDVTPIAKSRNLEKQRKPRKTLRNRQNPNADIKKRLKKLVSCGEGFVVKDTPDKKEIVQYLFLNSLFNILPEGFLGSSSTKSTLRGFL